jgi:transposase
MKKILKQALGIDVAQKELVVSLGGMHEDLSIEIYAYKVFPNTKNGFSTLVSWVQKRVDPNVKVRYVMEATGVYHESLAYYLAQEDCEVSIVLPNKISNYFKTLETKTSTDKTASETIARFGLERKLDLWKRPKPIFKKLRQLTRERDQIVQERTMAKNQLHAERAEAEPHPSSVSRIQKRITLLNKQEKEIQQEIAKMAKEDLEVSSSIEYIRSITGVGLLTTATVLGETNGFELIRNKRQITSYAGFDVGKTIRDISSRQSQDFKKRESVPAKGHAFTSACRHQTQRSIQSNFCPVSFKTWNKNESSRSCSKKIIRNDLYYLQNQNSLQ